MEQKSFFNELYDILEIEDDELNEETAINLTSLATLSVMAFVYENFEKQVKASELQKVKYVKDLMSLIGAENFN
jgi:acyl carrier protein